MNFSVGSVKCLKTGEWRRNKAQRQYNDISFKGNNKKEKQPVKRLAPWLMSMLMIFGAAESCSDSQSRKYSGVENYDGITVEFSNVSKETKDSVMKPVYYLKKDLTPENDFLNGVKFDITDDFGKLEENEPFKKFLKLYKNDEGWSGISYYSDSKLRKQVALQEIGNPNPVSVHNYPIMRHTLMHEVGHQFDNYFGHDHNTDFALKWDSLSASKEMPYDFETVTEEEQKIDIEYNYNNSLSDKPEFKKALLADLKNIMRMHRKHAPLPRNIDYFINNLDSYDKITPENIERQNATRAEIYAQLFAYAFDEDDGYREKFLECFQNCYGVVENDIEKYLNKKNRE